MLHFFFFCQFAKQVVLMIVMIYFVSALWIGFSNHSNIYTSITVAKVIAKVTNCKQEHQHAQFVADLRALFKNWKIFENAFLITFSNLQFSSKFFASKYEFLTCYLAAKKTTQICETSLYCAESFPKSQRKSDRITPNIAYH